MSITFERLDNEDLNQNLVIITGNDIIFKIVLRGRYIEKYPELKKIINYPNLCLSENLEKIEKIKSLSSEQNGLLERLKKQKNMFFDFVKEVEGLDDQKRRKELIIDIISKKNRGDTNKLSHLGKDISQILNSFGLSPDKKSYYFCKACNIVVSDEGVGKSCPFCGNHIHGNSVKNIVFAPTYLINYLNGYWFEDYVAKAFISRDWKVWTNLYIVGSSGVKHEVDLLAINKNSKDVVIGECKTGKIGRKDIFTFFTKNQDISGHYSYFFNLKEVPEPETKKFMKRKNILWIDNISSKTEEDFFCEIFSNISDEKNA